MGDFAGHPFRGNQYTRAGLISQLTHEDRKRSERAQKRGSYDNPHAIALEFQAADRVDESVKKGMDPSQAFADEFNPTASNHRIAKKLGLDLEVERGRWQPKGTQEAERAQRIAELHQRTGTLDFAKEEAKASKMTDAELRGAREDARKARFSEVMGSKVSEGDRDVYGARAGAVVKGKLVQGADGYWREETKSSREAELRQVRKDALRERRETDRARMAALISAKSDVPMSSALKHRLGISKNKKRS